MLENCGVAKGAALEGGRLPSRTDGAEIAGSAPAHDAVAVLFNGARAEIEEAFQARSYPGLAVLAACILVDAFARERLEHGAAWRMSVSEIKRTLARNLEQPLPETIAQMVGEECENLLNLGLLVQKRGSSTFHLPENSGRGECELPLVIAGRLKRLTDEVRSALPERIESTPRATTQSPVSSTPSTAASVTMGTSSSRDHSHSYLERHRERIERVGRAYIEALARLESKLEEFARGFANLTLKTRQGFVWAMASEYGDEFKALFGGEFEAVVVRSTEEMRRVYAAERMGVPRETRPLKAFDRMQLSALNDCFPANLTLELPESCWIHALRNLHAHMRPISAYVIEQARSICTLIRNAEQHERTFHSILGEKESPFVPCIAELTLARRVSGIESSDRLCMGYVGFQNLLEHSQLAGARWQRELQQAQGWTQAILDQTRAVGAPSSFAPPADAEISALASALVCSLERVRQNLPHFTRLRDLDVPAMQQRVMEVFASFPSKIQDRREASPIASSVLKAPPVIAPSPGVSRAANLDDFDRRARMRGLVAERATGLRAVQEVVGFIQRASMFEEIMRRVVPREISGDSDASELRRLLLPFGEFIAPENAASRRLMDTAVVEQFHATFHSNAAALERLLKARAGILAQ